jgi:cob(I)alamin adenosyltransferase
MKAKGIEGMKRAYIHIYTGEGKGKTTASVGLALRAKSRGLKVLFIQLMKGGLEGGEISILNKVSVETRIYDQIRSPLFYPDVDIEKTHKTTLTVLNEILSMAGQYDLVVIDEFNNLLRSGILNEEEAVRFIERFPPETELVLTGRGATDRMIDRADYVTYMKEVKHPYRQGVKAREGIEF